MRTRLGLLLLLLLAAVDAPSAGAQDPRTPPPRPHAFASVATTTAPTRAMPHSAPQEDRDLPSGPPRHSWLHVMAYGTGGVIFGGWAGYMASQIAWSDWRDGSGRGAQRARFSFVGAALGLAAGILIGRRPPADAAVPVVAPDERWGPITAVEIHASSARTVTQLLHELRPAWLRDRGVNILLANGVPVAKGGVRVYLDGELLGGLDALDEVPTEAVTRVEFYTAAAASLKWGAGNEDGAILISTTSRSSAGGTP